MRGNSQVRFLGGGGAAMRCSYPTPSTPDGVLRKARFLPVGIFRWVDGPSWGPERNSDVWQGYRQTLERTPAGEILPGIGGLLCAGFPLNAPRQGLP